VSDSHEVSDGKFLPVVSAEETLPPKRRRYTIAFKLRMIEQADACTLPGALAMLLRREGIYFSTLQDFRKQKARGDLGANPAATKKTKSAVPDVQALKDLAASEREVRKLRRELERARALLDLQKKVSELMGLSLEPQE
jgi:transposase-like protein